MKLSTVRERLMEMMSDSFSGDVRGVWLSELSEVDTVELESDRNGLGFNDDGLTMRTWT